MHALLLTAALALAHDFHLSRLTVNYDTEADRVEFTLQTFADDLELAVAEHHGLASATDPRLPTRETLDLLAPTQHPLTDSLVEVYLRHRVRVSDDSGAPVPLRYLGFEPADDPYAMYVYLSTPMADAGLTVDSRYFTELFDDQQNVVVWQADGETFDYALLTARDHETTGAP